MTFEKLIRDNKVAILYSPGFGAGWSTWSSEHAEGMIFDKDLVEALERKDFLLIEKICETKYDSPYTGGMDQLTIGWLPVGTRFRIHEYDGFESIETEEVLVFTA